MIFNATYKIVNREALIEGFETEEPMPNISTGARTKWLTTKKSWKIKDVKQFPDYDGRDLIKGVLLQKDICERIDIVEESKQIFDSPVISFKQFAILRPTIKKSLQVEPSQLDKDLNKFANWCLVKGIKFNDSNQICRVIKGYLITH